MMTMKGNRARNLFATIFVVTAVGAAASATAQSDTEICRYCVPLSSVHSIQVNGDIDRGAASPQELRTTLSKHPAGNSLVLFLKDAGPEAASALETKVYTRHVCEGTEIPLTGSIYVSFKNPNATQSVDLGFVTICDGTVVDLDTYRSKPFVALIDGYRTAYRNDVKVAQEALSEAKIKSYLAGELAVLYAKERDALTEAAAKRAATILAPTGR